VTGKYLFRSGGRVEIGEYATASEDCPRKPFAVGGSTPEFRRENIKDLRGLWDEMRPAVGAAALISRSWEGGGKKAISPARGTEPGNWPTMRMLVERPHLILFEMRRDTDKDHVESVRVARRHLRKPVLADCNCSSLVSQSRGDGAEFGQLRRLVCAIIADIHQGG